MRRFVEIAVVTLAYYVTARLGLSLAFTFEQVTLVWPPTGVALAAVLLLGVRVWPGIALGAFGANIVQETPALIAAGIAAGNTLAIVAAAYGLRRMAAFRPDLQRVRDVGALTAAAGLAPVISATGGSFSLCLGNLQSWSDFGFLWSQWWLGDAVGLLIVGAVLLTATDLTTLARRSVPEVAAILAAIIALSVVAFTRQAAPSTVQYLAGFNIFPVVIWAAVRLGSPATALVVALGTTVSIWCTVQSSGPFMNLNLNENLLLLQVYMAIVAVSGLSLSAAIAERHDVHLTLKGEAALRQEALQHHRYMEEKLSLLVEASGALTGTVSPQTVHASILKISSELIAADAYAIWQRDPHTGQWSITCDAGLSADYPRTVESDRPQIMLDEPLIVSNIDDVPMLAERRAGYRAEGIRSLLVMPMRIGGEEVTGTLVFYYRWPVEFTDTVVRLATAVANLAASAIGTVQLYDQQIRMRDDAQRAEERYRELVNGLEAIVWEADAASFQFLFVSRQAEEILGYPVERWLNEPGFWAGMIHPDYREQTVEICQEATRRCQAHDFEYPALAADGRVVWLRDIVQVVSDAQGRALRLQGVMVDITDQKQAEQALRHSRQQLEEINATLEQRVAERTEEAERRAVQLRDLASELIQAEERERRRLAHVLHDHLQQLLVAARMHIDRPRRAAQTPEALQAVEQVNDLIGQSIEVARSLALELSPPILHDASFSSALEWLVRQMFRKYDLVVELEVHTPTDNLTENLKIVLFRAVQEILFNTVKHAGVDQARVVVKSADEGRIEILIEDRGRGFDTAQLHWRRSDGFGLLSIRERLESLGGRIEADSRPGHGARFRLLAPVVPELLPSNPASPETNGGVKAADAQSDGTEPAADGAAAAGRIRMLVVDDHRIVRDGLVRLLSEQPDIEVVGEASDGLEAVELARSLRPDVISMDVTMPRLNGTGATRRITAELPTVRVIGLSMHQEEDMARAMLDAGAVAYVAKDGPPESLISAIRNALQQPNTDLAAGEPTN